MNLQRVKFIFHLKIVDNLIFCSLFIALFIKNYYDFCLICDFLPALFTMNMVLIQTSFSHKKVLLYLQELLWNISFES